MLNTGKLQNASDIFLNGFIRTVDGESFDVMPRYKLKRAVFYGVNAVITVHSNQHTTEEGWENLFRLAEGVMGLIGLLYPDELEQIFPIDKTYDGDRYEMKDYFYTRKMMDSLPAGQPIGSEADPMRLLWDYDNFMIRLFVVEVFECVDGIRRFQGQKSIAEEWCEENGISTYTHYTDQSGKQFFVEKGSGKAISIKKPKPRSPKWIHVVK